ncbi:hypothetical protein SAMD00019534_005140, partial [Acytostelium subglobosum LB1]|uniref:hypothetical protein n=1 Tax=Acytostelium subglobosum LB1 TaxID=1410327 RepID=UPI000644D390
SNTKMKSFQIVAALLLITVALSQARNSYFVFTDGVDEFTIKLTDPTNIQHARDLITKATTERPHIMGNVIKEAAFYNYEWNYQLNTTTIKFFDFAAEACDASISYVDEHLAEVGGELLPGSKWCPWRSRLVRE